MQVEKLESEFYRVDGEFYVSLFYNTKTHRWIISNLEGELLELTRKEGETVIKFLEWLSKISSTCKDAKKDTEEKTNDWIELTNSFAYTVKDGKFKLGKKTGNGYTTHYALDYELVKKVYDELPEKATSDEVLDTARKLGLKISQGYITYLMHFYARYVDFDAELKTEYSTSRPRLVLVKSEDFSLSEENKRLLQQEMEVIGTFSEG